MVKIGLIVAAMAAGGGATAQYYDPGFQDPGFRDPSFRDPGYGPRGYYARPDLGRRCEAGLPTDYGVRPLICPIVRARPIGQACVCPAPPRFGGGNFEGRVIP